jgi:hypothetical protein
VYNDHPEDQEKAKFGVITSDLTAAAYNILHKNWL